MMKHHFGRAGLAALALLVLGGSASAATLDGVWLSQSGETQVRIGPCGDASCGVIVWMKQPHNDANNPDPAKRDRPLVGSQMISGLKRDGEGRWSGSLYNFENGKTYTGTLEPQGDKLKLSGCVLGGLLCRSQVWTAAK